MCAFKLPRNFVNVYLCGHNSEKDSGIRQWKYCDLKNKVFKYGSISFYFLNILRIQNNNC